jgi:hypothetical protein
MREANGQAMAAFAQMLPEHRCTERCCINPPAPELPTIRIRPLSLAGVIREELENGQEVLQTPWHRDPSATGAVTCPGSRESRVSRLHRVPVGSVRKLGIFGRE